MASKKYTAVTFMLALSKKYMYNVTKNYVAPWCRVRIEKLTGP